MPEEIEQKDTAIQQILNLARDFNIAKVDPRGMMENKLHDILLLLPEIKEKLTIHSKLGLGGENLLIALEKWENE